MTSAEAHFRPAANGSSRKACDLKPPPMAFLTYDDMLRLPKPEYLIDRIVPKNRAVLIYGKSNSFKSFLGIDMACSVGTARDYHGLAVHPGRVLYIATEGGNGVGRIRIPGWMEHHKIPLDLRRNVFLWPKEVTLDTPDEVRKLVTSINHEVHRGGFVLVVVDIFGGSMVGPETKDETARAWVHGVQRIIRECGVTVLTIAHTGWADETRARMHTHFWGSFDTRLKVEGNKDARTTVLAVDRHKDDDSTGQWGFRLDVASGPDGTSTLVPVLDDIVAEEKANRISGKPLIALQALDEALVEKGRRINSPNLPACPVVELDQWREYCHRHGLSDGTAEARKKAFQRAKDRLHEQGAIRVFDGFVWRAA